MTLSPWRALLLALALASPLDASNGRTELSPEHAQTVQKSVVPIPKDFRIADIAKSPAPRYVAADLAQAPAMVSGPVTAVAPGPLPGSVIAKPGQERPADAAPADPPGALEGQARFAGALFERLGAWFKGKDLTPRFPGKEGAVVRLGGRRYPLEKLLSKGDHAAVYRCREGGEFTVTLFDPVLRNDPRHIQELSALQELSRTDIPHARLRAASADGLVLVQEEARSDGFEEYVARWRQDSAKRGPLRAPADGLAELAARLIRRGRTADLSPANLEHGDQEWRLRGAQGFAPGRPWQVLRQLLEGDLPQKAGIDPVAFLGALRGRFGPDSPPWRAVAEDAARAPPLKHYLAELARAGRNRLPKNGVEFVAMPEDPVFNDAPVGWSEIAKRLGFDPRAAGPRSRMIHDAKKTNTELYLLMPDGRPPLVLKLSDSRTIRNELAMRRIVRRFFGKYLDTPRSLGALGLLESGIVMDYAPGSASYTGDTLNTEQRVAMALLARTFGLTDANRGNVLSGRGGRAVLIDFEQAFARMEPNSRALSSLQDYANELPWVSLFTLNGSEPYLRAARAWRPFFLKSQTQAELAQILRESGFSEREIPSILETCRANLADLEWGIQNDLEYANFFVRRDRPRTNP